MSEANEVPITSHMGRLDVIQTSLKALKMLKYIFITILELTESFKTMKLNRPDLTVTFFDGLFLGKNIR